MIVTFQEIYQEVLRTLNLTEETVETAEILEQIKMRINMIQDFLFYRRAYEWRKRRFFYTTKAPITTGTVTVTNGSRSVTGSGTSWTDVVKLGYILIENKAYKIDPNSSITSASLKLVAPYPEDSSVGKTYKIIFPNQYTDPDLSSIVSIYVDDKEKSVMTANRLTYTKTELGEPIELAIDSISDFTYYETGTVTMTQDSKAVTGSGTTFTSDMEGMTFRVNEFSVAYTIQEVTGPTTLLLKDSYQGYSGAGKSYQIAPKGSLLIHTRPVPDDNYFIELEGLIKAKKLVRPNDVSLLPDHAPLLFGALWFAYSTRQEKNPVKISQAKSDFRDSLAQFDRTYKVVANLKWVNPDEKQIRTTGSARLNNPLERN